MNSRHCVVTGGAGFIGSHLVDRLIAEGNTVTVIDNFSCGQLANLSQVSDRSRLRVVQADVADADQVRAAVVGAHTLYHLAALADIVPSVQRPKDYHHANVNGTITVMEAAREAGIKRVVYAASSSCYGIPDVYPTPEDAPLRPQYPYALTKMMGEQIALHWHTVYSIPVVSVRFFNVYGPRSRTTGAYGAVFGVFLRQKLAGVPFTVVGDGNQCRDFIHVSDVVAALVAAAQSDVVGMALNVGAGRPQSINRLTELLGGERTYIPKRPGEPDCTSADISRIRRLLGWEPRVSFEDGVADMLANIERWRDAPLWTPAAIADATADWFRHLGKN